jgi:hypothetical protein
MAERFESLNELSGGASGIAAVEIVVSQFSVGCIGLQHLKRDSQNLVAGSNDSLPPSASGFRTVKESAQIAFFTM